MKIPKNVIVQFRITEQDLNRLSEYLLKTNTKSRSDFFRKMILKKLKLSEMVGRKENQFFWWKLGNLKVIHLTFVIPV